MGIKKPCTKCGVTKPVSDYSYHPKGKYGRQAKCKACYAKANSARYHSNVEVERERSRLASARWSAANPEKRHASRLAWIAANPEKDREAKRKWDAANPDYKRAWHVMRRYGLPRERYLEMLTEQGGRCLICSSTKPRGYRKTFVVDHDHATGKVRGLLCHPCNAGIGLLQDNPEWLLAAYDYLTRTDDTGKLMSANS